MELRQDRQSLAMTATLPPIPAGDRAIELVRTGQATGLSVEFQAVRERHEDGLRVIEESGLVRYRHCAFPVLWRVTGGGARQVWQDPPGFDSLR